MNTDRWAHGWRIAGAAVLGAALTACGGGGGGGGDDDHSVTTGTVLAPPTAAATLAANPDGAVDGVRAAVAAAQRASSANGSLIGTGLLFGGNPTGRGRVGVQSAGVVRATDSDNASCYEVFGTTPCEGRVSITSSFDLDRDDIPAGSTATLSFDAIRAVWGGAEIALDGQMKFRFETTLEGDESRWTQESIVVQLVRFSGRYGGAAFGPVDAAARLEIDALAGTMATTIDGIRYSGLQVQPTASGSSVSGGTVRISDPAQPAAYVDVTLSDWQIADGRPLSGSATVAGSGGVTYQVTVDSTGADVVRYSVVVRQNGNPVASYAVVATYAGGTPSYAIAPN